MKYLILFIFCLTCSFSYPAAIKQTDRNGREFLQAQNFQISGDDCILNSTSMAYALYEFPTSISYKLEITGNVWIAVGNYEKNRWRIESFNDDDQWHLINSQSNSINGKFYIAIIAYNSQATIHKVSTRQNVSLEEDTIYVWFSKDTVQVGEPVDVTVVTGTTSNPFQYADLINVLIKEDADYVPDSFNIGAIGGGFSADGLWAEMIPTGFFLAPDSFIGRRHYINDLYFWMFNVTPIGGHDIFANGEIFNFQFTFSEPGVKEIDIVSIGAFTTRYSNEDFIIGNWISSVGDSIVVE